LYIIVAKSRVRECGRVLVVLSVVALSGKVGGARLTIYRVLPRR
jgi:hypothetical protein